MNIWGVIFVANGIFSLRGATFNWDWFMNNSRARFFVRILTRTGARIFYALLGCGFIVFGILLAMGIIKDVE